MATQDQSKLLWTRRECATALGMSERTVYELTKSGALPSVRFGARGVRYSIDAVKQVIDSQLTASSTT